MTGNAVPVLPVAAQFRDAQPRAEQVARRGRSQQADGLGANGVELARQELAAGVHLVGFRRAVARRAALHDVADVDVVAADRNPSPVAVLLIICVSSWPARPTNGSPWASSSAPGPSPTKTSLRVRIAAAEDDLRAAFVQPAAGAVADVGLDLWSIGSGFLSVALVLSAAAGPLRRRSVGCSPPAAAGSRRCGWSRALAAASLRWRPGWLEAILPGRGRRLAGSAVAASDVGALSPARQPGKAPRRPIRQKRDTGRDPRSRIELGQCISLERVAPLRCAEESLEPNVASSIANALGAASGAAHARDRQHA